MNSDDFGIFSAWIANLLTGAPVFLAYLGLIVLALIRWRRERFKAMTTLSAGIILLLTDLASSWASIWLPLAAAHNHDSAQIVGLKFMCVAVYRSTLHAVSFVLLAFAIFSKRDAESANKSDAPISLSQT